MFTPPASLFARLGLLALGALLAMPSSALLAQNMFRGDPAHSGAASGTAPTSAPKTKWAFKTGAPVIASPSLADGLLFIGSDDKNFYAIDAATGAEKWRFATSGPVRSTAAVVGGIAYFGSYDGAFYAVDVATGKQRWKFETEGERKFTAPGLHGLKPKRQLIADLWDCYLSSPTVVDGRVFFGSGDGHIYALDAESGALLWKHKTGDVVHASPAVADGTVYIGSWDANFYALDAATGAVKWKLQTGTDPENHNAEGIQSSATIADGMVYFGNRDFHLYAVTAAGGEVKWKTKYTWVNATPTVRGDRVYGSTSIPAYFFALDRTTGTELYKTEVKFPAFASPTIVGDLAYVGTFGGKLFAIDVTTGAIRWEFQTEASKANVHHAMTETGEINFPAIFTSDFFEYLPYAFDAMLRLGAILSSPVANDGVLYFGSGDGNVYALE